MIQRLRPRGPRQRGSHIRGRTARFLAGLLKGGDKTACGGWERHEALGDSLVKDLDGAASARRGRPGMTCLARAAGLRIVWLRWVTEEGVREDGADVSVGS